MPRSASWKTLGVFMSVETNGMIYHASLDSGMTTRDSVTVQARGITNAEYPHFEVLTREAVSRAAPIGFEAMWDFARAVFAAYDALAALQGK